MTAKRKVKTERDILLALALSPIEQEIYGKLDTEMRLTDIASLVGIEAKSVAVYVLRMQHKGLIKRVDRGVYRRRFPNLKN